VDLERTHEPKETPWHTARHGVYSADKFAINPLMEAFRTFAQPFQSELKEKGSRFIAFGFPVENEEEIKMHLNELRQQFPDATHHCYAYKLGQNYRANDDGEHNNSAGLPIYRQILSSGLDQLLIVVVRYFGGKKLGIPGLIKAYGAAAKSCMASAPIIERHPIIRYKISASPEFEYQIFEICTRCHASLLQDQNHYILTIDNKMVEVFHALCEKFPNLQLELN
jgi:uncharacterized YigZ family protein